MKLVCAWCGALMHGKEDDPVASHGICEACAKRIMEELEAQDAMS